MLSSLELHELPRTSEKSFIKGAHDIFFVEEKDVGDIKGIRYVVALSSLL